ncbi:TetR family transcriptional regulator [Murinocardiopsis flavida]|uniref:TetR family transcriptional regulator n=1 Tax=Murinocardiopsis flavida TaxID=645275 RepID=A0A2P8DP04_9ACTN|nr:TetR/AcrR family transcriptional regulator [Murinocardiopsis flavida]PSK98954.1 TetR family transcriptional regulator [Murinocardiopsis flavida]
MNEATPPRLTAQELRQRRDNSGALREAAREANKMRLCEAAETVLHDVGYDRLTMPLIAAQAGLKAPALYNHYGSKRDLLADLIRRRNAELFDSVDLGLREGEAFGSYIGRLLDVMIGHWRQRRPVLLAAVAMAVTDSGDEAEGVAPYRVEWEEHLDFWAATVMAAAEASYRAGGLRSPSAVPGLGRHAVDVVVEGCRRVFSVEPSESRVEDLRWELEIVCRRIFGDRA